MTKYEGRFGWPRIFNIGPFTKETREHVQSQWDDCPPSGKPRDICESYKFFAISILENREDFPHCNSLISINSGKCFNIARAVQKDVKGITVLQVGDGDHAWVEYNGRHYDAEAPSGVDNFRDLPFFNRVPDDQLIRWGRWRLKQEGRDMPETVEDTILDITEGKE